MRSNPSGLGRLLVLLTVLAMVVAACGQTAETTTTAGGEDTPATTAAPEATTTTSGATATTGGGETADGARLRVGVRDDVEGWDSSRLQGVLFPFHRNLYDTLADYKDGLNAEPMLATDWEINEAGDSFTITLRDDVVFHSGRAFTAEDVAANLEYFMDEETGNQVFGPTAGTVADWEVTGDYEIVVNLQRPTAELQITDLLTSWAIGDPEFFDVYGSEAHGTGPFVFSEWVPGESVSLDANPDYWGEGPFIDGVDYRIFGDTDAMVAALEAGDIDVLYSPLAEDATRLGDQGFTIVSAPPGAIIDQFRIDASEPPWDNANLRLALSYAMDMDAINEAIYGGLGTVVRLPYSPDSPAFDQELADSMNYDMAKAQELLDTSGLGPDELQGVVMTSSADPSAQLVSQIVQASMAELGFDLQIELADAAAASDRYFNSDFQVYWSGIGNAQKYPTRISTNSIYRTEGNAIFDMETLFPDYVAAINQANAAVTPEDQAAAFEALNTSLVEGMWAVSGIARPMLALTAPNITGAYKDIDAQERYHLVEIGS